MYNIVIILLFVFKLTESKQLHYCPEVVNPNSPHGLTLPIKLNVNVRKWKPAKGNNIWHNFTYFLINLTPLLISIQPSDRQDCKWDVFNAQNEPVGEATAIYNNSERNIEMKGENITFEEVYVLQAKNDTHEYTHMVYLSERPDNLKNKTGFWNHTTYVSIKEGLEVNPNAIVINITNYEFLSFFLIKGKVVEGLGTI